MWILRLLFVNLIAAGAASVVNLKNVTSFESFANKSAWIIEFYAPWCSHCQKLESTLEKVGDYAKGVLEIAKIDAIKNPELAFSFGVTHYPSLFYKHNHVMGKYEGGRDFVSFSNFIDNLDRPALVDIEDLSALNTHLLKTGSNVSFVFGIPSICMKSESLCDISASKIMLLAESLKFRTFFAKLSNYRESTMSLCKYSIVGGHNQAKEIVCASHNQLSSIDELEAFIKSNDFPLVSELEAHNFKLLSHLNKTMVIAVMDFNDAEKMQAMKQSLVQVALSFSEHDASSIIFGFLDGIRWKKFAKHHEAVVPCILVADHDNERHAVVPLNGIKRDEYVNILSDTVELIKSNSIDMRPTTHLSLWRKLLHRINRYGWLSIVLFASPVLFFGLTHFFPHPKEKKAKQH